ncbi:MAG: spore coat protein CotJB [Clostridia bacterium]|nr:spore coat protein CotJB [Clostridia bacterium]
MTEKEMLKNLTALDFMAVDLQLYLDTHPNDTEALEKYNSIIKEADMLRSQYEKNYGPLFSFRSYNHGNTFKWINEPWPWKKDANFDIKGEDD